jgi:hypothetical protein
MHPIANFSPSFKLPSVAPSYADMDADLEQLAARLIAARFGLAPNIAVLVCHLAGIGEARQ